MSHYPHLASRLFNTPLLLHPDKLAAIVAGLGSRLIPELEPIAAPINAYVQKPGSRVEDGYRVVDGVAVVDIIGLLAHRTTMKADSSMVMGYDWIARQISAALSDPAVRAIVLNIDSPGGEVSGAFQLADHIRASRSVKPIHAIASDLAASAGYLIACAAETISLTDTAQVGSIGVVTCHADYSEAMAKQGVKITPIFAGAHKVDGHPWAPLPEAVAERIQADIDHYYSLFVSAVATSRPALSDRAIRATEAALFIGSAAIRAGLADRIETPDQLIARLAAKPGKPNQKTSKGKTMTDETTVIEMTVQESQPLLTAPDIAERCAAAGEPALGRALLNAALTSEQLNERLTTAKTIRTVADRYHMSAEATPMILAGLNVSQAIGLFREKEVKNDEALIINTARGAFTTTTADNRDKFLEGATAALMSRAGLAKLDSSNEFRRFGLKSMAEECLRRIGENPNGFGTDLSMVKAAITHSSSDFPVILENVLNKTLLETYAVASDTWRQWCAVGSVSDFRPYKRIRTGSFGNLDALLEGGEYKHKAIPDGTAESVSIGTKANTTTLTRQAIINDDLGGFTRLAQMMARAAARSIEADAYALLTSNPALDSDNKALFHADHGNYHTSGSAAAINMTSLDAARTAIKIQKDRSGNDYIGIQEPFILLCPVAKAGAARTANESEYDPDTAQKLQRTNITRGILSAIVDTPYLSGTGWYLLADPMQFPTFEVLFLNGQQAPFSDRIEGQNIDGITWLIRHDYGVNVVDYVGACFNTGA